MNKIINLNDHLIQQAMHYAKVRDLSDLLNLALAELVQHYQFRQPHQQVAKANLMQWRQTCKIGDVVSPLNEHWNVTE